MAIKFSALMLVTLLAAASTAAAQSANRSGAPAPAAPTRVETLAPEREAVTNCRRHCDAVTVSGSQGGAARQSGAERQARQRHCAKRMTA